MRTQDPHEALGRQPWAESSDVRSKALSCPSVTRGHPAAREGSAGQSSCSLGQRKQPWVSTELWPAAFQVLRL